MTPTHAIRCISKPLQQHSDCSDTQVCCFFIFHRTKHGLYGHVACVALKLEIALWNFSVLLKKFNCNCAGQETGLLLAYLHAPLPLFPQNHPNDPNEPRIHVISGEGQAVPSDLPARFFPMRLIGSLGRDFPSRHCGLEQTRIET